MFTTPSKEFIVMDTDEDAQVLGEFDTLQQAKDFIIKDARECAECDGFMDEQDEGQTVDINYRIYRIVPSLSAVAYVTMLNGEITHSVFFK